MAWTTPRTWTTSELVTASIMNTHLRDQLNYLYSGKEAFYLPAKAWQPASSNGCGSPIQLEHTAQRPETLGLPFDKDSDEHAILSLMMPRKWNRSTITFQVHWTCQGASTSTVQWALAGVAVGDGQSLDVAQGAFVGLNDAAQNMADALHVTAESGSVTIAGSPADGDLITLDIMRDVSADSLAEDAYLLGVMIFYSSDQHFEA